MAALVDKYKGELPFCFKEACLQKYARYNHNNNGEGLYFAGSDEGGHYYLIINPLGHFDKDISVAVNILKTKIYYIFPGNAIDIANENNPEATVIEKNHTYKINRLLKWMNDNFPATVAYKYTSAPEVLCLESSSYHFTFEAQKHILQGTAIHGLFKDQCGDLYMFQQGRGIINETWVSSKGSRILAYGYMWDTMADSMKEQLNK